MAGRRHAERGGILSLADILEDPELGQAVEADLIEVGLRYRWLNDGTDRLNWRDVQVLIGTSRRSSRLFAAMSPEMAEWTTDTDFLSAILFTLQGANWQRGGGKGPKPQKIDRPGAGPESYEPQQPTGGKKSSDEIPKLDQSGEYPVDAIPQDEMARWLGWS